MLTPRLLELGQRSAVEGRTKRRFFVDIHDHASAALQLPKEHFVGQGILDLFLNQAIQGTGSKIRIVSLLSQPLVRRE